jgi:hypothetical protein
MLLAIDTSAGTSVAIVDREAGILAEHSSEDTRRHAEVIGDLIAACLADSGVPVHRLSDAAGLPVRTHGPALARADQLEFAVPGFSDHRLIEPRTVSAASLGLVAELLYANGRPFAADEPIYLRSPDVTLSAGPKRVTS